MMLLPVRMRDTIVYPIWIIGALMLTSCYQNRIPPKRISGVVREKDDGSLLAGVSVRAQEQFTPGIWVDIPVVRTTGYVGYFDLSCRDLLKASIKRWKNAGGKSSGRAAPVKVFDNERFRLVLEHQAWRSPLTVSLGRYNAFHDVLADDTTRARKEDPLRVADMHYHITMRAQNALGQALYDDHMHKQGDTTALLWFKSLRGLRVPMGGRWRSTALFTPSTFRKANDPQRYPAWRDRLAGAKHLLEGRLVRAKTGNNGMRHFSQATLPHTQAGRVLLGYNAISPFEHNLNNTGTKRFVSVKLKSGCDQKWLARIGKAKEKDRHITHWQNFNAEYALFKDQDTTLNASVWRRYYGARDLDDEEVPAMMAVLEGSHVLQHRLFPTDVDFDMEHRDGEQQGELVERLLPMGEPAHPYYAALSTAQRALIARLADARARIIGMPRPTKDMRGQALADRRAAEKIEVDIVDSLMASEISANICELKNLPGPPVRMVTVSHLSFNGMTGHAPAIDDGGGIAALIAQKVYNIRVSEDPSYLRQWKGLFFTVPGVNKFGKLLMTSLLDTTGCGRRILLDLKHSDLMTRRFFYDSLMVRVPCPPDPRVDSIPPICSHCAVTGLSENYYSPFNNEYRILRAPFTTRFYPFGINLYDEEILRIHRNKGIVGLTLEQRVLGGYINKRTEWGVPLRKSGKVGRDGHEARRWNYLRRYNRYVRYFARLSDTRKEMKDKDSTETAVDLLRAKAALHDAMLMTEKRLFASADSEWLHANARIPDPRRDSTAWHWDHAVGRAGLAEFGSRHALDDVDERILDATTDDYISAEPFLQNLFYVIDAIMNDTLECPPRGRPLDYAWKHVCIGSDLDGLIDPIDICATADMYPYFHERLRAFIPLFLQFRTDQFDPNAGMGREPRGFKQYFHAGFTIDMALDQVFYKSLKDFTQKNFP